MSVVKILKNGVAIIICAAAIFTALPYGTFAADNAGDLKIGDYICLGKYYGLPIIWRYAADDEHGKFILSDKIISKKPFHTSLKNTELHGDGSQQDYSNSYWKYSHIRLWLNSKAAEGEVNWFGRTTPAYYEYEKGFLSDENFSATERAAIKKVHQKTALNSVDSACADGGDAEIWEDNYYDINTKVFNEELYDNILYEYTDDMIFLPDLKQIQNVIKNTDVLGLGFISSDNTIQSLDDYIVSSSYKYVYNYIGSHTPLSKCNSAYFLRAPYVFKKSLKNDNKRFYDAYSYYVYARYDNKNNYTISYAMNCGYEGIRPAFYLNEDNIKILSGRGTENDPYVIDGITAPDDGNDGAISGTERTTPMRKFIDTYINGTKVLAFSQDIIENNRVYIPLIMLPSLYNCVIENIDHRFEDVEVWTRNLKYSIKLNYYSNIIETKDGSRIEMDCYPKFVSNPSFVYVPLRAVTEQLGGIVEWVDDENGKRIYISIDLPDNWFIE